MPTMAGLKGRYHTYPLRLGRWGWHTYANARTRVGQSESEGSAITAARRALRELNK